MPVPERVRVLPWGIYVIGTLALTTGSKLVVANSASTGVQMDDGDASGALVSDGGHITVANSGASNEGISGNSGSAVTLTGGSLTVENTAGSGIIGIDNMDISNCPVTVNSGGEIGFGTPPCRLQTAR